jgi:putative spermidine/putrescine transport system permease protein
MLIAIDEQLGSMVTGSLAGLVLAHVMITTPWVVRLCLASLTNHDRAAEEAAASLGANPLTVIWRVTLPAMRMGIIAGALFAFVVSFENLELALFLTSPGVTTLPVAVLQYLEYHIDPLVSAVAVAQTVGIGGLLLLLDRFMRLGQVVR